MDNALGATIVTFTRWYQGYNAGEVAGFPPAKAGELINGGVALYKDGPVPPNMKTATAAPADDAGGDNAGGKPGDLATATHALNAKDAVALVEGLTSADDVAKVRDGEVHHPKYTGGRQSVLDALDARAKAIADAAAGAGDGSSDPQDQ